MHYRTVIGIAILAAVCIVPIVSALPATGTLFGEPAGAPPVRTGNVTVTMVNSLGSLEKANIRYVAGDVFEVPVNAISASAANGTVSVSLTSAVSDSNPATYTLLPPSGEANGYTINTVTVEDGSSLLANDKNFSLIPAATNYYSDEVPAGKQHEWIDLDWNDNTRDLGLTVYAPDATFGPYWDMADGKKDGRIFLDVGSLLNVTPGHWFFKVQNSRPEGVDYTLNTYSV